MCFLKIDVMGVQFDNVTMEQALDRAEILIKAKASAYCVTPNGEIVWEAMHDGAFLDILNRADLVLPDGAGVIMGSRILERPLQEKVAGIAFAEALVQRMAATFRTRPLWWSAFARPGRMWSLFAWAPPSRSGLWRPTGKRSLAAS